MTDRMQRELGAFLHQQAVAKIGDRYCLEDIKEAFQAAYNLREQEVQRLSEALGEVDNKSAFYADCFDEDPATKDPELRQFKLINEIVKQALETTKGD